MSNTSAKGSSVLMVVPTLGQRLDHLKKTLESLTSQATYKPDVVIVCPLNNKPVVALAKEFNAQAAADPGSLSGALNVGFKLAKPSHRFAGWLGDDDLLRPDSLKISVQALEGNSKAVIAFGSCDYIDEDDIVLFTSNAGKLGPLLMSWGPNLVPLPGTLYRFDALRKAGDFDPTLKYAMDLDMLLRLRKLGSLISTGATLGAFRWHTTSTTVANRQASLREAERVKRRYLPAYLKPVAPIWELPVQLATTLAVKRVNRKRPPGSG